MSIAIDGRHDDARYTTRGGVYVPAGGGPTKWFSGDVYTVRLPATATNGSLGFVEASVPPGSGPVPHTHADQDETFYLLSGELEFLDGDRIFTAGQGDIVHVPRKIRHGTEELFIEGGDEPQRGVQVQPWGPERFDDRILGLFAKYGTEALPDE